MFCISCIEKDGHMQIEREYRLYPFLLERNVYSIEDEFHFFMECSVYGQLRNMYLYPNWRQNVTLQHFYTIMKLENDQSIIAASKCLISAFSLRSLYHVNNYVICQRLILACYRKYMVSIP